MKKILLVALAAAAMVSCSQNEEIENAAQKAEIKFGTVVGVGTKAIETTTANFEEFAIYGYYTGDKTITNAAAADMTKLLLDDVKAIKSVEAWNLTGGPYYWPLSGNTQFFAYSPFKNVSDLQYTLPADKKYPTLTYTVAAAAENQKDLLVSSLSDQKLSQIAVSLPFKHALTQVNFSAKTTDALTFKVTSVKLTGVMPTGTYDFENGQWVATGVATSYTYTLLNGSVEISGATPTNLGATNSALMLIPQAMTNVKIAIDYDVLQNDIVVGRITNSETALLGKGDWTTGTKVRYTLTLSPSGLTEVLFTPSVNPDWSAETDPLNP